MYLLFRNAEQREIGNIKIIGTWNRYAIGYVPDDQTDIQVEYRHLNPKIIDEGVAWAWMYWGSYRGYISVRTGTAQNEKLQLLSSQEATGEKTKYQMTDEDKANTTTLMKEVMRMMLDEIFDKRFLNLNTYTSNLEGSTWQQQKAEALADGGPLLQALADARGITLKQMVSKVLAAVEDYNSKVTTLLAQKQQIEQEVKNCQNIGDCNRLMHNRFELEMPSIQRQEEGITYSAKYDI